jgi:hypothetical protein
MTVLKHHISKTKTIYLCGPIDGCTPEEMHGWRDRIKYSVFLRNTIFESGAAGLAAHVPAFYYQDPTDRVYALKEGQDTEIIKELVLRDKFSIEQSDIVVANLSLLGKYRCVGSIMEIMHSFTHGKFVLTIAPLKGTVSPWIAYHSAKVVTSEDEAISVLANLA